MKWDIADYVSKCFTCQEVKADHQKHFGLLQPLLIPQWKWEHNSMDFVVSLPRSQQNHDPIWLVVYWLTKSAHLSHRTWRIQWRRWADYTYNISYVYTEYLSQSYLTEIHDLRQNSGEVYKKLWELQWAWAQLFICRPMDKRSESIKWWKICYVHASSILRVCGKHTCRWSSSLKTTISTVA